MLGMLVAFNQNVSRAPSTTHVAVVSETLKAAANNAGVTLLAAKTTDLTPSVLDQFLR